MQYIFKKIIWIGRICFVCGLIVFCTIQTFRIKNYERRFEQVGEFTNRSAKLVEECKNKIGNVCTSIVVVSDGIEEVSTGLGDIITELDRDSERIDQSIHTISIVRDKIESLENNLYAINTVVDTTESVLFVEKAVEEKNKFAKYMMNFWNSIKNHVKI